MTVAELPELTDADDAPITRDPFDVPDGYELIDGELREMPAMGAESSWVVGKLFVHLDNFLTAHPIGVAMTAEAGYQCFPDRPGTVRKPDAAVILCDPATFVAPRVNFRVAPALVIEVLSPSNTAAEINAKTEEFLSAGTKLVWVVDPELRAALVFRADDTVAKVREAGELSGEDVLPGFALPLAAVLPRRPAAPPA